MLILDICSRSGIRSYCNLFTFHYFIKQILLVFGWRLLVVQIWSTGTLISFYPRCYWAGLCIKLMKFSLYLFNFLNLFWYFLFIIYWSLLYNLFFFRDNNFSIFRLLFNFFLFNIWSFMSSFNMLFKLFYASKLSSTFIIWTFFIELIIIFNFFVIKAWAHLSNLIFLFF
jgi:hypothetical protein